jgi:anti-sigma regulatory factor (Ser/Thr protein kinase)
MKSDPKSVSPQLNLALLDHAPAELPQDEQQELALALVELLVNAATPSGGMRRSTGGQNEFETHE